MIRKILLLLFTIGIIAGTVSAVPTTGAVTGVSAGQATFHATGAGSVGWFQWGAINGGPNHWTTPNITPTAGVMTDFQYGPPMLSGTTYYVVACDNTGCGNQVSWTTPTIMPLNQSHYGDSLFNATRFGMNATSLVPAITRPYTGTMTTAVAWGLLFFFLFTGMWMKPKDIFLPCIMAIIAGGAIWMGNGALGVPPEWADIGQGLMYAAIAGIAFSWFTH
jgi:hypothetical protein